MPRLIIKVEKSALYVLHIHGAISCFSFLSYFCISHLLIEGCHEDLAA